MAHFYLYNNTIYQAYNFVVINPYYEPVAVFKNNVIYGNTAPYYSYYSSVSCPNCSGSNNLYYGGTNIPTWDLSTLTNSNPLWTSGTPTTYLDFKLQTTSPARDAGTSSGLITAFQLAGLNSPGTDYDFEYKARGSSFDIGAYEYASGTTPPPDTTSPAAPSGVTIT